MTSRYQVQLRELLEKERVHTTYREIRVSVSEASEEAVLVEQVKPELKQFEPE